MSTLLKSFYHNLREPIIIYDSLCDNFYQNKACRDIFGNLPENKGIEAIKKIGYNFHFDFCLLDSENVNWSPFDGAIQSKIPYTVHGIYQKNEMEFLHFTIKAFSVKKYRIIYFYDYTKEFECEKIVFENEKLKIQNQKFANTNSKAQNQAVKMALLNRISTSISKTLDMTTLVTTALKELSIIFASSKLYFSKRTLENDFEIEFAYPKTNFEDNKTYTFDNETIKALEQGKVVSKISLKEHEKSKKTFPSPLMRIIMPVFKQNELFGAIIIFTTKKVITELEQELLVSVSMQISNAFLGASLFLEVNKQKEELQKALNELKETQLQLINTEKMASLGQLIASVAHEINTPIASISANNEMLRKLFSNLDGNIDSDIKNIFEETNKIDLEAIKRITNLVRSLKRFVRLDEQLRQQADINKELDLTLEILRHKTKKGIVIVKNYGTGQNIECYPNMLNQVFLNILMNAIQSIEKEKTLQNDNYEGRIEITTKVDENLFKIEIKDNGNGIKEADKKKIFQAGFTTKKIGEGTGLGLAICKKIIEKHKGSITFDSFKNKNGEKNTIFIISIPILD